jgi:hypothetical protein
MPTYDVVNDRRMPLLRISSFVASCKSTGLGGECAKPGVYGTDVTRLALRLHA